MNYKFEYTYVQIAVFGWQNFNQNNLYRTDKVENSEYKTWSTRKGYLAYKYIKDNKGKI